MNHQIAIFIAPGEVELRTEARPTPGPGEALVELRACALCTMEQRLWTGRIKEYPIAPGPEAAGVVVVAGPAAAELPAGARVALAMLDRCMQCYACRRGDTHLCTGKLLGREPGKLRRIGGLGEYVVVPTWKLFRMPAELSFEEIALSEPLSCVVHSVNKGALRLGDDALILGGGTMGQLHVMTARLRGARVLVSEPDPEKRRAALGHGAAAAFDPAEATARTRDLTGGRGADVVFVTHGTEGTAREAAESVRSGGRIIYYGSFPADASVALGPAQIHNHETVLDGARSHTLDDWSQATRLLARRLIDVRGLISATYPLAQIGAALDRAAAGAGFRVVVNMGAEAVER